MKEVTWKETLKYGFVESLVAAIWITVFVMSILVALFYALLEEFGISDTVINTILWIIGIAAFGTVFALSIWDARRQLMYPKKRYGSYSNYSSYGNYVDRSGFGYDSGGGCDCGDSGCDGGC